MKQVFCLALALVWSVHVAASADCMGRSTWERMIEAKGGRQNLEAVHSLFVDKTYSWRQFLVRRNIEVRTLYRLPDFVWSWFDNGTPQLGISLYQAYLDRDLTLRVAGPSRNPRIASERAIRPEHHPLEVLPILLLETRWLKPSFGACVKEGNETVVEAVFDQMPWTYRYHLRDGIYLPHRVELVRPNVNEIHEMTQYKLTQGIWFPSSYQMKYGNLPAPIYQMKYSIDPNYDETLPDREPSVDDGPDAWRGLRTR
jgi:hypothetical protein